MTVTEQDLISLFRRGTTAELNDAITRLKSEAGEQESIRIYDRALETYNRQREQEDGPVHEFFGLTYASYQVVARVLAQSMPHEWQARFVALMEEYEEAFAHLGSIDYDVRPAQDFYVCELTEEQMALVGVTSKYHEDLGTEIYWDRDGNEIEGYTHIMVPVPDPLPSYNRGRTRVPRADQIGTDGGDPR